MHYRLLHVEDDPVDVRLFGMMLRELHVPTEGVSQVGSVEAALDVLRHDDVDVVFLDLDLPDSAGIETVERLLTIAADVPVVVMTGHRDEELGVQALSLGAQDYLVKETVHAGVLGRVMRFAIERHRAAAGARRPAVPGVEAGRPEAASAARSELAHEVDLRREAQDRLEVSLARLRALKSVDTTAIPDLSMEQLFEVVLEAFVPLVPIEAATFSMLRAGEVACVARRGFEHEEAFEAPLAMDDPAIVAALAEGHARYSLAPGNGARAQGLGRWAALERHGVREYHVIGLEVHGQPFGVLELFVMRHTGVARPDWLEFVEAQCVLASTTIETYRLRTRLVSAEDEILQTYDTTIAGWSRVLGLRDRETMGHTSRVATLAVTLARTLGMGGEDLDHLRRGALLHDIGKIAVPDAILQKVGPLTCEERAVMQRHTDFARDLLEPVAFLKPALDVPYAHHERWDGSGYPRGLAGEEIPLAARIFTVVDVYDALTSDRPYRRAWSPEHARAYLAEGAGRLFDPAVVDAFLALAP